jgi:adenylate cyclase
MLGPWTLDEFAELVRIPADDIKRYQSAGLVGVQADGQFSGQDVLRVQIVRRNESERGGLSGLEGDLAASDNPIERALFKPKQPSGEALSSTGLEPEEIKEFRTAFGFAMDDLDEDDVEALRTPKLLRDAGLPPEAVLEGARVYGDALRRIADTGMQISHRYLCEPMGKAGHSPAEIVANLGSVWAGLSRVSIETVRHLYLDFLIEAAAEHAVAHLREDEDSDAPPGSISATIVFADLALFSSLAELEGDEAAVGLVDRTDRAIRTLLLEHGGKLVKQIGDEFMLAFPEPAPALRFAREIQVVIARTERGAAVRIGMHHGRLLFRLGDYYGRAVNMASRIASMATPGSIIVTEPIAKAAANEGLEFEEIGVRSLRGMDEPVGLYRVSVE